jgi:predicted transcriptional regulator
MSLESINYGLNEIIIGIVIIFLFIIFVYPSILRQYKLFSRARRDYQLARGSMHLRQIRNSLKILNKNITNLEKEKQKLEKDLHKLNQRISEKLLNALSHHLVVTRLSEIEGIGPILRERIILNCFDGTLGSLRRAYGIERIGHKKLQAISRWVDDVERNIPHLLKNDFPNKRTIIEECERDEREINEQLKKIEERIAPMNEIKKKALEEKDRLSIVGISHFRKSYQSNYEASELVNQYLNGVFPEWEPMPIWFKTLISEYGV